MVPILKPLMKKYAILIRLTSPDGMLIKNCLNVEYHRLDKCLNIDEEYAKT